MQWMLIKAGFSRHIAKGERRNASRIVKGEREIWQRRYWERMIRDEHDYERHVDYVHLQSCEARAHQPRRMATFDHPSAYCGWHPELWLGWAGQRQR